MIVSKERTSFVVVQERRSVVTSSLHLWLSRLGWTLWHRWSFSRALHYRVFLLLRVHLDRWEISSVCLTDVNRTFVMILIMMIERGTHSSSEISTSVCVFFFRCIYGFLELLANRPPRSPILSRDWMDGVARRRCEETNAAASRTASLTVSVSAVQVVDQLIWG